MKILTFVDTHGSEHHLEELRKKAEEADLILCAGDVTIFEAELEKALQDLNDMNKPIVIIHGNHESEHAMEAACKKHEEIAFIHQGMLKIGDFLIVGYGGGGFDIRDKEFEENIAAKFVNIVGKERVILMVHGPPYGTELDKLTTGYVGNKSFTEFIEKHQPELVICGHLHEHAEKEDKIGNSRIINPGPRGKLIDLE